MFELPEELKKISAGKIIDVQSNGPANQRGTQVAGLELRGRQAQKEDD